LHGGEKTNYRTQLSVRGVFVTGRAIFKRVEEKTVSRFEYSVKGQRHSVGREIRRGWRSNT